MNADPSLRRRGTAVLWLSLLPLLLVVTLYRAAPGEVQGADNGVTAVEQIDPHLTYGFNIALWDEPLLNAIGFTGVKLFGPPNHRLPYRVLLRVDADASHLANPGAFVAHVSHLAQNHGPYIDAYEIGNEPNLDASYGWNAPPVADDYTQLLCLAYQAIKAADPRSVVISAGLAPTGRVTGNWNGHPGHNGLYQDEREYLREMFQAGAADCLDAVGYHPYGFSADFDAEPDIPSGDPALNCANGFCFRGVEKIYEIMDQEYGLGHKEIWVTEFGWITPPPPECMDDPSWQGRQWQIVSEAKQASNLAGAFQYAHENYPWMGGMYIFNLNFNHAGYYPQCEQMRYYAVADRPAQTALANLPKFPLGARMADDGPNELTWYVPVDLQPLTLTTQISLRNSGWDSFTYSATADGDITAWAQPAEGEVGGLGTAVLTVHALSDNFELGMYQGQLTIQASPGTVNPTRQIALTIWVMEFPHRVYIPIALKN